MATTTTTIAIDYDRIPSMVDNDDGDHYDDEIELDSLVQIGNDRGECPHHYQMGTNRWLPFRCASKRSSPYHVNGGFTSANIDHHRHHHQHHQPPRHHCRNRPFESHQLASNVQVPFSPLLTSSSPQTNECRMRHKPNLPLRSFLSSRTRHWWWSIMFYTFFAFLVFTSQHHLVESILVRDGSELNRTPASVKGKS